MADRPSRIDLVWIPVAIETHVSELYPAENNMLVVYACATQSVTDRNLDWDYRRFKDPSLENTLGWKTNVSGGAAIFELVVGCG